MSAAGETPTVVVRADAVLLVFFADRNADAHTGLAESAALIESAGADLLFACGAHVRKPNPRTLIGAGKVAEVRALVEEHRPAAVVFDCRLSPIQERNLEQALCCRVVDRTALILDIFAQRARTYEGKLQVELAQLNHLSTRLVRGWSHLERQKGGIGLRGPGETQLETDRRLIRKRQLTLENKLDGIRRRRALGRRTRRRNEVSTVALVGYTNAGKSTLFNRLTGADAWSEDRLFATLDPTLRRLALPGGGQCVLADTVGFVRDLPAELVMAFRATLEEVAGADLLLHVVDGSQHSNVRRDAVRRELKRVGAAHVPELLVLNKADLVAPPDRASMQASPAALWTSAATGEGLSRLREAIATAFADKATDFCLSLPQCDGALRARLYEIGGDVTESFAADGDWQIRFMTARARFDAVCAEYSIPERAITYDGDETTRLRSARPRCDVADPGPAQV